MPAGMNIQVRIWRYLFTSDDSVGGAQPTGTVLYDAVLARKITRMPDMTFLEQGLETERISQYMLWPATLLIKERDEIQITSPSNHLDYNKKFKIVGIADNGFSPSDARGYLIVSTSRSEVSHRNM
jgi:hypothetical protein